jgi:hypothetical protein
VALVLTTVSVTAPLAAVDGALEASVDAGAELGAVDAGGAADVVGAVVAAPPEEQAAAMSRAVASPKTLVVVRNGRSMGLLLDSVDVLDRSPGDVHQYVGLATAGFSGGTHRRPTGQHRADQQSVPIGSLTVPGLIPIMALGIR